MKRKIPLLLIIVLSADFAFTQCDNFSYFLNEVITPANEAYFNLIEFERICTNLQDMDSLAGLQAEIKKANKIISEVKDNFGFLEVATENARANAENCYCINGQKTVAQLEGRYETSVLNLDEAGKYLKLALKTKNIESAKQYIAMAISYSVRAKDSSDLIVKIATDGMNSCN